MNQINGDHMNSIGNGLTFLTVKSCPVAFGNLHSILPIRALIALNGVRVSIQRNTRNVRNAMDVTDAIAATDLTQ